MSETPVFGRRKPPTHVEPPRPIAPARPSPSLAELGVPPSVPDEDDFETWRKARGGSYVSSLFGWRGAGAVLGFGSAGLNLLDLDLLSIVFIFGALICIGQGLRRPPA